MAVEQKFLINLPDGVKQNLSGVLNHIMDASEYKIPSEAGSAIDISEIPEEEMKMLSSAIYQAVRNHRIRMQFWHLRQQGLNVDQATKRLEKKVFLDASYIRNIVYRK